MTGSPPDGSKRTPPSGIILALDTAGAEASVALGRLTPLPDPLEVLSSTNLRADEEHASLLLPRVNDLLVDSGVDVEGLSGVVVGAGPGSFTGVRVGAATAKGLAWALGIPLWAFSSLASAAADVVGDPIHPRLVLFDARGDRVYAAAYRAAHGSFETLLEPLATTVGEVLHDFIPPGAVVMGNGAIRHKDLFEGAGIPVLPLPAGRPSARGLLRLFASQPEARPLDDVGRWEPEYLRESGAERMWKTRPGWEGR